MRAHLCPAFTLFEMMIVMAIMVMLVGVTAGLENRALQMQRAEAAAETLRLELIQARNAAMANTHDGPWGLQVQDAAFVEFHGSSYASRDQVWDEYLDYDAGVAVSGNRDYVFQSLSGTPIAQGQTDLADGSRVYHVKVNKYGAIWIE